MKEVKLDHIRYLLKIAVIPSLLSGIVAILFGSMITTLLLPFAGKQGHILGLSQGIFSITTCILTAISTYILIIIGAFLGGLLLLIGMKIVGIEANYEDSLKAIIFGNSPAYLFSWIPVVNFLVALFVAFYTLPKVIMALKETSYGKALLAEIIPIIAVVILLGLFAAVLSLTWIVGILKY